MSFTSEDDRAYQLRREELGRDFAAWVQRRGVAADPQDAQLLLDWKWGYGDGHLGRWSAPDIEEFLLDWCPRKLSSTPDLCADIPLTVATFVDFLADRGLLAPGSQSPAALRRYCEKIGPRFQREMADPANFGMAKSLLGGGFADSEEQLLSRLRELTGTSPEELLELLAASGPEPIGPVRLPTPGEHLATLRAAPTFRQVRGLAERCPAPGLVTTKGNLRPADAQRLAAELDTGDEVETTRPLHPDTELPALAWVVELAMAAGAVIRTRGRLAAGPEFAALADPEAYRRLVRSAVQLGLANPDPHPREDLVRGLLDASGPLLLAELLDAHTTGQPVDVGDLIEAVIEGADPEELPVEHAGLLIMSQLGHMLGLGLVHDTGGPDEDLETVSLTAAGVSTAVELVPELLDVEVIVRPDPLTSDAAALLDTVLMLDRPDAEDDLRAWSGTRPDPATAATELLIEITAPGRPAGEVLTGLDLAGAVLGESADAAARPHQEGPHGPLVLNWLLTRGAIDPAEVDPHQLMFGMVTVAATLMDSDGPAGAIVFVQDADREQVLELLDQLWRLDHPRLPDVLDAIGGLHPDKKVAKQARRCLMQYRSRVAQ